MEQQAEHQAEQQGNMDGNVNGILRKGRKRLSPTLDVYCVSTIRVLP